MKLNELIKVRGLPLKVKYSFWPVGSYWEIVAVNGEYAIGFTHGASSPISVPFSQSLDSEGWVVYNDSQTNICSTCGKENK